MAFGRPAGAVTAVLHWLSNPIWIGGTLSATVIATLNAFVLSKPLGTTGEILAGASVAGAAHVRRACDHPAPQLPRNIRRQAGAWA